MRTQVICAVIGALATRIASANDHPSIHSRSAVVLDAATGQEIFSKDADEIRPIASTTKIFVAMDILKTLSVSKRTHRTK